MTVARGQKIVEIETKSTPDAEMIKLMLGPSGNLRAPTVRIKDHLYIGFSSALPIYKK